MSKSAEMMYWEGVHNEEGFTGENALKILAFIDMCFANKTPLSLFRSDIDKDELFCFIAYKSHKPSHILGRGYSAAAAYFAAMSKYDEWIAKRMVAEEFFGNPEIQEKIKEFQNTPSQFRRPTPEDTGKLVQLIRDGDEKGRAQWELDMRLPTAEELPKIQRIAADYGLEERAADWLQKQKEVSL